MCSWPKCKCKIINLNWLGYDLCAKHWEKVSERLDSAAEESLKGVPRLLLGDYGSEVSEIKNLLKRR